MLWSKRIHRSSPSDLQTSSASTSTSQSLIDVPNSSNSSSGGQISNRFRLSLATLNLQSSTPSSFAAGTREVPSPSSPDFTCSSPDMSKSNIGRPILGNRTQYNEGEANGQQTKKKEDTSQSQGTLSVPPIRTPSCRVGSVILSSPPSPTSHGTPLPAPLVPDATVSSDVMVPPVRLSPDVKTEASGLNDDLYQGLSTFTFGDVRPSPHLPSPSYDADAEADEMISPLTAVSNTANTDRTPRPSVYISQGYSSHPAQTSEEVRGALSPPLARRSISASPAYTRQQPSISSVATDGSEGIDSEFADPDTATASSYFHASPSDRARTQHRASDASQHTFGGPNLSTSFPSTGSRASSRASSCLELSSDDDFDCRPSSPLTFVRNREDTSLEEEYDSTENIYARRGSLPIAIPGAVASSHGGIAMAGIVGDARREREDGLATLRRPSRSLDDDLRTLNTSFGPGGGLEPKSEPRSRGDWASLEAHVQAQQQQEQSQPDNYAPESNNVYQELGLNLEYVLGAGSAPGRRSSDAMSYVQAQQRHSSHAPSLWGWNAAGRRPSTVTVGTAADDTFARHVRKWDGRLGDWSFKREKADGIGLYNPWGIETKTGLSSKGLSEVTRTSDEKAKGKGKEKAADRNKSDMGMLPGTQEIWRCEFVGRFKVDRQTVQPDPTKLPHQRLNLRHIIDPYSRGNTRGGPSITIHKHSRAFAFSIYRAHNLSNRHKTRPGILLAPKRVQEQFTSTKTTSKLATYGLLEDDGHTGGGRSRASSVGRRDRKETEKERKKREAAEAAKAKKQAKKAKGYNSQTSSTSSTNSTAATGGYSSAPPPVTHAYPPAPAAAHRAETSARRRSPSGSTTHASTSSSAGDSSQTYHQRNSVSDQSTVREFYSSKPSTSHHDSFDLDERPPLRTPHSETYATLDSSLIEYVRANADRLPDPDPNPSFFKRFLRPGPKATVQPPNYPAGPTSASLEGQYKAPWLSMVGRARQEESDRVIHNLNNSFMGVGLLPANSLKPTRTRDTRPKKAENANVLEQVPDDSLYMLLPLWPGETDPASAGYSSTELPKYDILLEDRQYLLVYYVAFDQPIEKVQEKPRSQTSSRESASTTDERGILSSEFRAVARVVGYNELRGAGVRLPSDGMSMTGPMWEAVKYVPSLNRTEPQGFVIATCLGREHGVEIMSEGLVKMGLCLPVPERQTDADAGEWEEDAILSPIGRAAVEMAWAGCMALTSFGTV